jgi:hypothetical protein
MDHSNLTFCIISVRPSTRDDDMPADIHLSKGTPSPSEPTTYSNVRFKLLRRLSEHFKNLQRSNPVKGKR